MTQDELIAKLTEMLEIQQKLHETAIDMLKPAIEAEREACAKACEDVYTGEEASGDWPTPEMCASAIRARGENK
jgi:hypothetical protein